MLGTPAAGWAWPREGWRYAAVVSADQQWVGSGGPHPQTLWSLTTYISKRHKGNRVLRSLFFQTDVMKTLSKFYTWESTERPRQL